MTETNVSTEHSLEDLSCTICFRLFYEPITAPCHHSYCRDCLVKLFKKNNKLCPLCRLELHEWDIATQAVDQSLQQSLESPQFAEMYAQRKKEYEEEKTLEQMIVRVKVSLGNLHQYIPTAMGNNSHKWTFFLLSHEGEDLTKYIKKVVVNLHPTFHPNKITMSEEPFMFSRIGWGIFALHIVVSFHDFLEKSDEEFTHMLCFQSNGNATSYELEFDRRKFPVENQEAAAV